MLREELKGAVNDVKNPAIRIIIIASFIITSVLWGIVCGLVYKWGNSLLAENKELKVSNNRKDYINDSLRTEQYMYVLKELETTRKVNAFKEDYDSLNTELRTIKRTLISR